MNIISFLVTYLSVAAVYALLAISMNIDYGWAGIPDFGKAAFIAAGGIAAAIVATRIVPPLMLHMHPANPSKLSFFTYYNGKILPAITAHPIDTWIVFIISILLGGIIAAGFAVIFSYPAIRLKEDYLAIALLMAAQIVWLFLRVYTPIMGGTMSMTLPSPSFKPIARALFHSTSPSAIDAAKALFLWGLVGVFLYYAEKQMNSPFGRMLRMVRDDEYAAAALGKNVARARLESLIVASFLAGVAGAVYVLIHFSSVNPDYFMPDLTFFVLTLVLVGGVGNNIGSIIGALLIALLYRASYIFGTSLGFSWGSYLYYMIIGLAILITIFVRPNGILPEKPVRTPAWDVYALVRGKQPWFLRRILMRGRGKVNTGEKSE